MEIQIKMVKKSCCSCVLAFRVVFWNRFRPRLAVPSRKEKVEGAVLKHPTSLYPMLWDRN